MYITYTDGQHTEFWECRNVVVNTGEAGNTVEIVDWDDNLLQKFLLETGDPRTPHVSIANDSG